MSQSEPLSFIKRPASLLQETDYIITYIWYQWIAAGLERHETVSKDWWLVRNLWQGRHCGTLDRNARPETFPVQGILMDRVTCDLLLMKAWPSCTQQRTLSLKILIGDTWEFMLDTHCNWDMWKFPEASEECWSRSLRENSTFCHDDRKCRGVLL